MKFFVYLHIFPNEKIYVGKTTKDKPEKRWQNGYGYKGQPFMWNAIRKYGWENIKHRVIECRSEDEMNELEKHYISEYETQNPEKGYNIYPGGESGPKNYHLTEEHKRKISEGNKGKVISEETRQKRIGHIVSESTRKKISEKKMGHIVDESTRKKISEKNKGRLVGEKHPMYGKHHTEDAKRRNSEAHKGKTPWNKGKGTPEEVRRKISEGRKNTPKLKWLTPNGEIKEMYANNAKQWHPDWVLINEEVNI